MVPHFRLAVSVGLLAGFVVGTREAVLTLGLNTAAQAEQYFFVYLAVPILAWIGDQQSLTPHLDRLESEGVAFDDAITAAPWTLPAIASLFTGLDPHHHGAGFITNRRDPLGRSALPPATWTFVMALRDHTYRTNAIVTNPYLALRYGLGLGFDTYENVTIESEASLAFGKTTAARLLTWLRPRVILGDRGETVSEHAIRWLSRSDATQPFFLWLHYIDPHPPYSRPSVTPHKSFRGDVLAARPEPEKLDLKRISPDIARLRSGEIRLSDTEKDEVRDLYRAEVTAVDTAVGEVLDAIDEIGLRDRTLVVCVADHGEELWDHGGVEHGHTVYDELTRIPLLMRWPGRLPAKLRVDAVVRTTDVAPTVFDLLGISAAPALDGATLLPLVRGEASPPRVALTENMLFAEERVGVRTAAHKYIRWANGKEELYDLVADPKERRDLAANDALLATLRATYAAIDFLPGSRPSTAPSALDARSTEAMRALGYLHLAAFAVATLRCILSAPPLSPLCSSLRCGTLTQNAWLNATLFGSLRNLCRSQAPPRRNWMFGTREVFVSASIALVLVAARAGSASPLVVVSTSPTRRPRLRRTAR